MDDMSYIDAALARIAQLPTLSDEDRHILGMVADQERRLKTLESALREDGLAAGPVTDAVDAQNRLQRAAESLFSVSVWLADDHRWRTEAERLGAAVRGLADELKPAEGDSA